MTVITDAVPRLRQLTADVEEPYRRSDDELEAALTAGPTCPLPCDAAPNAVPLPDTYYVAADLWEDEALTAEVTGPTADAPVMVTQEKLGDASVSYGGDGKLLSGTPSLSPGQMRALAARLRKRACNKPVVARTVGVLGPNQRGCTCTNGTGLCCRQAVNLSCSTCC